MMDKQEVRIGEEHVEVITREEAGRRIREADPFEVLVLTFVAAIGPMAARRYSTSRRARYAHADSTLVFPSGGGRRRTWCSGGSRPTPTSASGTSPTRRAPARHGQVKRWAELPTLFDGEE